MELGTSINNLLKKDLKNPEFKREYEAENGKLESAYAVYKAREEMGWTQAKLAKRADVPRSTVSSIESGNNTTIETLNKLAFAMGKKLSINIK